MDLYFLRHATAEPDGERPLSDVGRKESKQVASWLADRKLELDALFTSPLPRAEQTARIVGRALDIEPEVADALDCGASLSGLRGLLAGCGSGDRVMLVGHEPDFSQIISELVGGGQVDLKKAGLARVSCDRLEPGAGVLRWLLTPGLMGAR